MQGERPVCIHCRKFVNPHKVETCLRWVALEKNWRIWRGLE